MKKSDHADPANNEFEEAKSATVADFTIPGGTVEDWKQAAIHHHEKAVQGWHSSLQHAWWCGRYLCKIKRKVAHGRWLPWLEENFPASERTARYYMQLAKSFRKAPDAEYAESTMRDALENLVVPGDGKGKGKLKDTTNWPRELVRQIFKILLKEWEPEEIVHLRFLLDAPPGAMEADGTPIITPKERIVEAFEKVHRIVGRDLDRVELRETKAAMRRWIESSRRDEGESMAS